MTLNVINIVKYRCRLHKALSIQQKTTSEVVR